MRPEIDGPVNWRIARPVHRIEGAVSRISTSVMGEEVWFESPDARLEAEPEAFASAFMIQALRARATIDVDAPLDSVWLANTKQLLPIYRDWWGYPERYPVRCTGTTAIAGRPSRPKGLFFTAGADSFHSLLRLDDGIECLVYVQGFDLPLENTIRMAAWDASFRRIAARTGKRPIVVRTNLRSHSHFKRPRFLLTHGGAFGAVAHVLSREISDMLISSIYRYHRERPWGSHWDTDPLWSSGRVTLRHGDATLGHHGKLQDIAHEPIVAEHLHVCSTETGPADNCSRCEKCLRTMVSLEAAGALERFSVFAHSESLSVRLDRAGWIRGGMHGIWEEFFEAPLSADTHAAVRRLLRRSRRRRARRRLVRRMNRLGRRIRRLLP